MLRLSQQELAKLQSDLERTGNQRGLELAAALIKIRHIYGTHESGDRYDANRERALLMKHNFLAEYQRLSTTTGTYRDAWTLFDLRPLRSRFSSVGRVDRGLERLIFGYDLLVLIPRVTAQDAIE